MKDRPLDAIYPVIVIDATCVKARGQVTNRPFYVVIGVTVAGARNISGSGPATVAWRQVLGGGAHRAEEPWCRRRVHRRVRGLKGLPDVVTSARTEGTWSPTTVLSGDQVRSVGARLSAGVVDTVRLVLAPTIIGTGRRLLNHPSGSTACGCWSTT